MILDLDTQIEWAREEMGHGHDKTSGYQEKLRRLSKDPDDETSVMFFISGYWKRFRIFADNYNDNPTAEAAGLALVQIGKVASGLADKIGLVEWVHNPEDSSNNNEFALQVVRDYDKNTPAVINYEEQVTQPDLSLTVIGKLLASLHGHNETLNLDTALDNAANMAVHGFRCWGAYFNYIQQQFPDIEMPAPGQKGGGLEPWIR